MSENRESSLAHRAALALRSPAGMFTLLGLVIFCAVPLFIGGFFLQVGLFMMAAGVASIGLTILVGTAGQLSLAHAFFVGVGAYGYGVLAGDTNGTDTTGLGLPPVLAALGAVACAGVLGWLFSFVARRLRGIYLGIASMSLPLVGIHLIKNLDEWTGGFAGLRIPPMRILGFEFSDASAPLVVLGVEFGRTEQLWYLFLLFTVVAVGLASNLLNSRSGRAMRLVRDSEIGAEVMGASAQGIKAQAFVVSSLLGGAGGVMFALAATRVVPETFGIQLSIQYVATVIVGGLGSVAGAVLGAILVQGLVLILPYYSKYLPFLAQAGEKGITASWIAVVAYGLGVVACTLFLPGGVAQLTTRAWRGTVGRLGPKSPRTDPHVTAVLPYPAPREELVTVPPTKNEVD